MATEYQRKVLISVSRKLYIAINMLVQEYSMLPPDFKFDSRQIADEAHAILLALSPQSVLNSNQPLKKERKSMQQQPGMSSDDDKDSKQNYTSHTV